MCSSGPVLLMDTGLRISICMLSDRSAAADLKNIFVRSAQMWTTQSTACKARQSVSAGQLMNKINAHLYHQSIYAKSKWIGVYLGLAHLAQQKHHTSAYIAGSYAAKLDKA